MVPDVETLKRIIRSLDPSLFGVTHIEIESFEQLGLGEGNLNYIVSIAGVRYVCRVNIERERSDKTEREFRMLERIAAYGFSPKPVCLNREPEFSILEFIEGTPFQKGAASFTPTQIERIARVLAELHSVETGIEPRNVMYGYYTIGAKKLIEQANERTHETIKDELETIHERISKLVPDPETHEVGLIHGDICPQNIVKTDDGIALIDWENTEISDPARDVANVMIDLKLEGADLALFLKTYGRVRADGTLHERAAIYSALMLQNYFAWEIVRTSEIIERELPEPYLEQTSSDEHLKSAREQLDALGTFIDVPEIDIESLFSRHL